MTMPTAVQELATRDHTARVVFGAVLQRVRGSRGPIALVAPGTVIAYSTRRWRDSLGCVFRAAQQAADGGDVVPGVAPAPRLLLGFVRDRQFDRVLEVLQALGARADAVPNERYLRSGAAIMRPCHDARWLADTLAEGLWTY